MSKGIEGNTRGLAPAEIKKVQRLFQRRIEKDEIVGLDLARELCAVAAELRRRVGLLVSREGRIEEVFLGTKDLLYMPELGRYRLGKGRLRRMRLVFSDLSSSAEPGLPSDIRTDLEKLRFDMVVSLKPAANRMMMTYGHLVPVRPGADPVRVELVRDLGAFEFDFASFMSDLEDELASNEERSRVIGKTTAMLVGVYEKKFTGSESSMAELEELARTAGVTVVDKVIQRRELDPKTLLGKGKLEEVVLRCLRVGADMLIFDTELKPSQWRVITNSTELKVVDRSMLILDIFGQRAQSSDGKLQVELAQLKYNLPKLVEKDAGLSRLTGGIGGRGPGETKLEIGRRRIRDRISDLEKRIDKLSENRDLRRKRRTEREVPLVSVLGYTNVGKSTLFNALTGSKVVAENKLFATLDPAQRRLVFPPSITGPEASLSAPPAIIISDTVGFIRNLPAELVNAFRATLEQLNEAALLLHVLDASDPEVGDRKKAVEKILEEMDLLELPQLIVLNKIDKADPEVVESLVRETRGIPVSALKGTGLDDVLHAVYEKVFGSR